MLENIAFPTPGFSDAPITAMDCGARKLPLDWLGLYDEDDEDGSENEEGDEELVVEDVDKGMEKVNNITYKCVYALSVESFSFSNE